MLVMWGHIETVIDKFENLSCTSEEAIKMAKEIIHTATKRDPFCGIGIDVLTVTKQGTNILETDYLIRNCKQI